MEEAEARSIATNLGLKLGGGKYAFVGGFKTKGLYAYKSGALMGHAFFGEGGTASEQEEPVSNPATMYRPSSECPTTESKAREICSTLGLALGGHGVAFVGNYKNKGLYAYSSGKYAGMAFFSEGGTPAQMQATLASDAMFRPTLLTEQTSHQSDRIHAKFDELDTNKDGVLTFDEVKDLFKNMNSSLSERQLMQLFCEADADQSGELDKQEFLNYIMHGHKKESSFEREAPVHEAPTEPARQEWIDEALQAHNDCRAYHHAPPLLWSEECYRLAKRQADYCQRASQMLHGSMDGPSGQHGQNIYWCATPGSNATACTKCWYDEIFDPGYDFANPGFHSSTGHFTQVVWKGTTSVGMACSADGKFVVANYFPAGNFQGLFPRNVLPHDLPEDYENLPKDYVKPGNPKEWDGKISTEVLKDRAMGIGFVMKGDFRPTGCPRIGEVTAKSLTPEMDALLVDNACPYATDFKDRINKCFQKGGEITVTKVGEDPAFNVSVMFIVPGNDKRFQVSGSWGGG